MRDVEDGAIVDALNPDKIAEHAEGLMARYPIFFKEMSHLVFANAKTKENEQEMFLLFITGLAALEKANPPMDMPSGGLGEPPQ